MSLNSILGVIGRKKPKRKRDKCRLLASHEDGPAKVEGLEGFDSRSRVDETHSISYQMIKIKLI